MDFPVVNPLEAHLNRTQTARTCPACTPVSDAFVAKLNSTGSTLLYSTYLGGSGADVGRDITVDAYGDAYVTGYTDSADFPTANTNHTTLQGGEDAFVTELAPAGNTALFSTYLGGNGGDKGNAVVVDPSGHIYVTGETTSSTGFPLVNPYQSTYTGYTDAFVSKFSPSPTAARVARFTAHRQGVLVLLHWRMASSAGVAAFNLYAGKHRLNHRPIPSHPGRSYHYAARWMGGGTFNLQVVLTDGRTLTVGTT